MNKQNTFSWMVRFVFTLFVATAVVFPGNVMAIIIYDNGTFASGTTSDSGVVAPGGAMWSEAQHDYGVVTGANTLAGLGCQKIGTTTQNRCADDFNVPVGQTWTIDKVLVYAYQTGFAGGTSPFIAGFLQIWNGRPGDPGSTVIFGDLTVNRLGASTNTNTFRIFNSVAPPPGSAPGTTRRIWQNELTVSPALALTAGNYWIDFTLDAGAAGNFSPSNTTVGTRGVPFSNGRQFISTGSIWQDAFDDGNPATLANIPQDFPFKLDGSVAGAPAVPRSRTGDYDGDNKTDLAVARAASAAAQATWFIRNSNGGTVTGVQWGVGIGFFPSGDRATAADFDGDGKTDVAVWRPGAPTVASFFILNSATSTMSIVPFGQTGDDSAIVGDYDGDGKADPAVFRPGSGQSVFYYRGSNNNPGGNVTFVPFGTTGDVAIQGDFDGDGKYDFQVARNAGGNAQHYRMINGTGAVSGFQYGLFSDRFVSGDFDADGRSDLAAIRTNGANLDWYVLMTGNKQLFVERFGVAATDAVTPGDYDGDKKWDIAVWRTGTADARFFTRNTFASPFTALWGTSAGPFTAPDYPIQTYLLK